MSPSPPFPTFPMDARAGDVVTLRVDGRPYWHVLTSDISAIVDLPPFPGPEWTEGEVTLEWDPTTNMERLVKGGPTAAP